jgi:uncharacterized protein YrrD
VRELGPPIAYLVVRAGLPVYDHEGTQVGEVEHVLADEPSDIFHGLIVRTGPPERHTYADSDQIAELHERGVLLSAAAGQLHRLDERAGAGDATDIQESKMRARLRESWEWVSEHR